VIRLLAAGVALIVLLPAGASAADCGSRVRIGPGETVSSIARRCGVNVQALRAANPGISDRNFQRGTTLNVPRVALPSRSPGAYGNQQIVPPTRVPGGVGQGIVIPGIEKIQP
jgi:LysM repeat protein